MTLAENFERDGFKLTKRVFINPSNTISLDQSTKRKITICNLFVNHKLSMLDIVRVLDEEYARVVHVLIEQGLIRERRNNPRETVDAERRRSLFRKH